MIAGAAFDLYVGQFTTGEVAQVCGVSRPVIDMWGTRGFIEPTRRECPIAGRLPSTTKERRSRTSKGKPLFSARDMFKAILPQVLAAQLGIALSHFVLVWRKAEKALIDAAQIADSVARSGEWMWATARSVENESHFTSMPIDSVGAKVAVRYAHHKSRRASVVRLGRAAPVCADVSDLYRRIHRLQKVARHLGPDHFRFIMTAGAPKLYTMRKPQSDCTKVRTGRVRCSQKKCGITQVGTGSFSQAFKNAS